MAKIQFDRVILVVKPASVHAASCTGEGVGEKPWQRVFANRDADMIGQEE